MFDFRSSAFLRKLLQQSGESEQETPSGSGGWGGLPRGFLDYLAPRSLPLPGPRVAPNATVPLEVPVGPEAEAWLRQLEKLKGKDIDDLSGTEYGRMREEERKGAENWRDLPERPPAQDIEGEEYHRKRREEIERGARGLAGDVLGRPDPSEIVDVEGEEFHRKQRELLRPTPAGGDPFAPEAGDVVTARVPVGRGAEVLTDQDVVEHGVEAVSGPYKDTMRQLLEFLTQEGGFAGFAHATQAISDIARREQLAEQIVRTLADPLGLVPAADQGIEPYFRDVAKLLDPSNTTTTAFTFTGSTRFPDFIVVGPNTTIPDYLARALQAYHLAMGTVTNPQDPFGTRPDTTARAGLTHELLHAIAAARARQLGIQSRNPLDEYYVLHDPIIGGIDDLAYWRTYPSVGIAGRRHIAYGRGEVPTELLARTMVGYRDFGVNQPRLDAAIESLMPLVLRGQTREDQDARALARVYAHPRNFADAMLEYWLKGTISDPMVRKFLDYLGRLP